jgi:hypothetical protein
VSTFVFLFPFVSCFIAFTSILFIIIDMRKGKHFIFGSFDILIDIMFPIHVAISML